MGVTMISAKARELVSASVPLIQERGEAIAERMYELLFERYPCIEGLFDAGDQESGTQARRFGEALLAYASHVGNLGPLDDALAHINRRHVDVGVKPRHYGLIAECLLEAMRDILADRIDDNVIAAWSEAYTALAGIFIANESDLRRRDGESAPRVA